jgi:glutamyl-tRNA synthetase
VSVRTRFAPSPTGRLHLGNVRVAVFNWLFARRHGGAFVLRLEDTDVERNLPGAEQALMDDLRWLGLEWDEGPDRGGAHGPYRQSERGAFHQHASERLLASGHAFRCFCAEVRGAAEARGAEERGWGRYPGTCRALDREVAARRAASGEPHVVRFRAPERGDVVVEDAVRGPVSVPVSDVDDFVLRRSDGRATYNFAVVVDDVAMAISHVIRGAGHLSNTPRQALLFDALGEPRPVFAHLPTVLDPEGGKLSKRAGATTVASYREAGYPPQAIVNYLSLLGWSDPEGREVLGLDELVRSVSLERVGASDTSYDADKLRWVSAQHLAGLPLADMVEGVRPYVDRTRFPLDAQALVSAVAALRTRLSAFGDIGEHLPLVLPGPDVVERGRAAVAGDPEARRVARAVEERLERLDDWEPEAIGAAVREAGKAVGVRGPALFHPVRLATTGAEQGPDLARILHAQGSAMVLERLRAVRRDGHEV